MKVFSMKGPLTAGGISFAAFILYMEFEKIGLLLFVIVVKTNYSQIRNYDFSN